MRIGLFIPCCIDAFFPRSAWNHRMGSCDTKVNLMIPKYEFSIRCDVVSFSRHDRAVDLSRISILVGMTPESAHGQL
jgi:hypothetical protein